MTTLASLVASGAGQPWEAIAVAAVAFAPMRSGQAVRLGKAKLRAGKPNSRHVELDRHTRCDIGLEPGSITWV
jgi:hypothetical protein